VGDEKTAEGEPVASPCVGICQLDQRSVCLGCGRLIGEIAEWSAASEMRRREIAGDAARRQLAFETEGKYPE
jgi:predicted Fe-S protein YdhL (DUF1289 family)